MTYGNPNWNESLERWRAFWNVDCLDRPGIQLFCPLDSNYQQSNTRSYTSREKWTDPEAFYQTRCQPSEEARGEGLCVVYPNWCGIETEMGADIRYDYGTLWVHPLNGTLEDIDFSRFSINSKSVTSLLKMLAYAAEHCEQRLFIGLPPMGNPGDTIARMRSYEEYCVDLYENPDLVVKKELELAEIWNQIFEKVFATLQPYQNGTCGWLPAWYEGKSLLLEFDFCALISPEHFDLFLPAMEARAASAEKTIWHLDGPGELVHLDKILSLPWIHAIQALPGAGIKDPLKWMEVYHKIQAAGKALYVGNSVTIDQARVLMRELKPEGLMLPVRARSKEEACCFWEEVNRL